MQIIIGSDHGGYRLKEEIAEYFECDERTIRRNKNKIINNIKTLLFPNDSIEELGN